VVSRLIQTGVDVARRNLAHGMHETHREAIAMGCRVSVLDTPLTGEVLMAGVEPFRVERCARQWLAASRGAGGTGG